MTAPKAILCLTDLSTAFYDWTGHWEMALKDCHRYQERGGAQCQADWANNVRTVLSLLQVPGCQQTS